MRKAEKQKPTLESRLLIPIFTVMIIIAAFVLVDIYFLQRTIKLQKALVLAEEIPWQVDMVAQYEERYLENRKAYVLGKLANALSKLTITFETLVTSSNEEQIQVLGKKTIVLIDTYQDEVLEMTDKFNIVSKKIRRDQREIARGVARLNKLMKQVREQRILSVPKEQRAQGLSLLVDMWSISLDPDDDRIEKQWSTLVLAFDKFDNWAKTNKAVKIQVEGNKISQIVGSILEHRKSIHTKSKELEKLSVSISESHNRFIEQINSTVVSCTDLLRNQLDQNNKLLIIDLVISLVMVVIMLTLMVLSIRSRLSKPILRMTQFIEKIQKGSLEDRVPIPKTRELERLAKAFNDMADSVYESRRDLMVQRDGLEKVVEERTADLKKVNSALVQSNKELDDFTYVVSHDLKEPLRGVSAFSKLLKEEQYDNLDQDGKEYVDIINKSAARMKKLINDLLELSRITRKRNPIDEFSILLALEEIKTELLLITREKNGEIILPTTDQIIVCDKVRIKQVMTNLINNGLKFNRSQNPTVKVKIIKGIPKGAKQEALLSGEFVTISVEDNGIGIDPGQHEHIFEIFQRLVSREEFEGTGAGLTIVKKIIEGHGGVIWLESEPEMGTTFYVALPVNAP